MSEAPVTYHAIAIQECRKYPRLKTQLQVEVLPQGAASAIHAATSNISCGGCYIETKLMLPVGTNLAMTLRLGEEKVMTHAVVSHHLLDSGIGFQFSDMSVQDLNKLNHFLQTALR